VDSERSSQLRALTLANRCLAREIRKLTEETANPDPSDTCRFEIERVVHLARTILDPTYSADRPKSVDQVAAPLSATSANRRRFGSADDSRVDLLGDGPPSPEHTLGFLGRGTAIPVPELVGFLGSLGIGGVLKVNTNRELFFVEFGEGHVVHAEATRAPAGQRLGDLLVSQGAIDRDVLEKLVAEGVAWKLGHRLVGAGYVTREQLIRALRTQIQLLFCRLFREVARSFTFWTGPPGEIAAPAGNSNGNGNGNGHADGGKDED